MGGLTATQIMQQRQAEAEAAKRAEEERKAAERERIRAEAKQLASEIRATVNELNSIASELRTGYQGIWSNQAADRMEGTTSLALQAATGLENI